jgi:hypothetical protein
MMGELLAEAADLKPHYYGPLNKAFGALDEEGQNALEEDLISLAERYNHSENGTAVLPADYLEVAATRR